MTKFPKTLGACVDELYKMRTKRLEAQAEVDKQKAAEEALREYILSNFAHDDVEGVKGKLAVASITRRTVAQVQDWDAFFTYVAKNKAFELLQRRVSDTAYREYLDNGKQVPGAEPFVVVGLSLNKSTK